MLSCFSLERRYANLGHLLPMFPIERAVQPGVSALPCGWPATYILEGFGHLAMPRLGIGHDISLGPSRHNYTSLTFSAHGPFGPRPSV